VQIRLKERVERVYESAPAPLSDFARFAREGLEDKEYGFVEAKGAEAGRQLLRFVSDLPARAGCSSIEQFVLGNKPISLAAEHTERIRQWEGLVSRVFDIAKIPDWEKAGVADMAEKVIPLIREIADFVYPLAIAWDL